MEITPGNNNQYFKAMIQLASSTIYSAFNGGVGAMWGFSTLSAHSTVPNPKGRINLMRFGPYFGALTGYGTNKIISGQWYLLGLPAAGPPPFCPIDLFANGEQGGFWDPSDLSTTFQDTAGTVPATADGQTVKCIKDKSGNGNHLTSSVGCTLHNSGSQWWLEFDGATQYLTVPIASFSLPYSAVSAARQITYVGNYARLCSVCQG
jgi:hypothetical protein